MTVSSAQQELRKELERLYGHREAANIAELVMASVTDMDRSSRLIHKHRDLDGGQEEKISSHTRELLEGRPVQYVLGEAWFAGMPFFVDEQVLIPRPETEELVEWAVEVAKASGLPSPAILDMGTGSGCIAIALKQKQPAASVMAIDKSAGALSIATRNAASNHAEIHFQQVDFLDTEQRKALPTFDLIVSNPPYIPLRDKSHMAPNVLDHEPHLALFVENDDPLLFYRALAEFGRDHLNTGGSILCEIHEDMGQQTIDLFISLDYRNVEVKKDMQGKVRMIFGYSPGRT